MANPSAPAPSKDTKAPEAKADVKVEATPKPEAPPAGVTLEGLQAQVAALLARDRDVADEVAREMRAAKSELASRLAEIRDAVREREEQATRAAQAAVSTTPARVIGSLTITDRMSEEEILRQIRAARAGHIPFEDAKRFRTIARIFPPAALKEKYPGGTLPLGTEIDREAFSVEDLEHYLAPHTRALEAIA